MNQVKLFLMERKLKKFARAVQHRFKKPEKVIWKIIDASPQQTKKWHDMIEEQSENLISTLGRT